MDLMALRIPPPLLALLSAVLMWAVTAACGAVFQVPILLPLLLFGTGAAMDLLAAVLFRAAKTTLTPLRPTATARLITHGVYRFSRNPMYLGLLLMLCAWGLWLGHPANSAVLVLFVWYITRFQIIPEERTLEKLFPDQFTAYRTRTRRWI